MRLIDSETLYERFCELEKEAREIREEIERLAEAGFIKVVRCKDCKYYEGHYCWREMKTYLVRVSDMDYCSSGERRDSNDTDTD